MADGPQWDRLARALRELHRALMERARGDYEREHLVAVDPGQLLRLLTTDPQFAWLRGLSELMADIDIVRDSEADEAEEIAGGVRAAVEHFVGAPKSGAAGDAFAQRYWPYVQEDPHVAMAHGAVKQALGAWPRPPNDDAASLLHERHRLAEKARHSGRKR